MARHESVLGKSWRDTERTRGSVAWWVAAVIAGATLAVAGYFVAPAGWSLVFAFAGVVIGFFAPYTLALVWSLPSANVRRRDAITRRR